MPFLIILFFLILASIIAFFIIRGIYEDFVNKHSILIKSLRNINSKYHFHNIPPQIYKKEYDNEDYYNTVAPIDYLTYQLLFIQKDIKKVIHDVIENSCSYDMYKADVNQLTIKNEFDVPVKLRFKEYLRRVEKDVSFSDFYELTLEEVFYKTTDQKNYEKYCGEDRVNIRKLTPNECRKLQGFRSDWVQVVSDCQAYKQFGNAVTVNVSYALAKILFQYIDDNLE